MESLIQNKDMIPDSSLFYFFIIDILQILQEYELEFKICSHNRAVLAYKELRRWIPLIRESFLSVSHLLFTVWRVIDWTEASSSCLWPPLWLEEFRNWCFTRPELWVTFHLLLLLKDKWIALKKVWTFKHREQHIMWIRISCTFEYECIKHLFEIEIWHFVTL